MLTPPRLEYYGDIEKASTLKGAALAFYQFVCSSMGDVQSIQREKRDGDTAAMQVTVWTEAYDEKRGVVKIYVAPIGSEGAEVLFPTSFNDTDLGTQIYKAPYPAKKQGELILADDNPNYLVLPTPTYSARTNYWVNDKENATVSWDYVEYLDTSYPVGHINRKRKYGKIAINGIETGLLWGKFLEPLACALIDKDNDGAAVQQIVIIYHDRVDYAGTGADRYIAVYSYELDFIGSEIGLTEIGATIFNDTDIVLTDTPSANYTTVGYGTKLFTGFFGDTKHLAIRCSAQRTYITVDYPAGILVNVSVLHCIELATSYDSILSDEIIYEASPFISNGYNNSYSGSVTTLVIPTENILCDFIDVRGNNVSFAVKMAVENIKDIGAEVVGPYFNYRPLQTHQWTDEHHLVSWSKKDGLKKDLLKSVSGNNIATQVINESGDDVFTSGTTTEQWCYVGIYLKKSSEAIYSIVDQTTTGSGWQFDGIPDITTSSVSLSVISKKFGELYSSNLALTEAFVNDYAYTKDAMVASIETTDLVGGDLVDKSFTLISDFKGKKRKIVEHPTTCISLTKLPKPP